MAVSVQMLQLSAGVAGAADQMGGVLLAQDGQGGVELVLLDVAVGGQVLARGASRDQVFARQQSQGARVVVVVEVDLGQPERIGVAVCGRRTRLERENKDGVEKLTGQSQHLVADVDGSVMLTAIQRILAPVAQELLHVY